MTCYNVHWTPHWLLSPRYWTVWPAHLFATPHAPLCHQRSVWFPLNIVLCTEQHTVWLRLNAALCDQHTWCIPLTTVMCDKPTVCLPFYTTMRPTHCLVSCHRCTVWSTCSLVSLQYCTMRPTHCIFSSHHCTVLCRHAMPCRQFSHTFSSTFCVYHIIQPVLSTPLPCQPFWQTSLVCPPTCQPALLCIWSATSVCVTIHCPWGWQELCHQLVIALTLSSVAREWAAVRRRVLGKDCLPLGLVWRILGHHLSLSVTAVAPVIITPRRPGRLLFLISCSLCVNVHVLEHLDCDSEWMVIKWRFS